MEAAGRLCRRHGEIRKTDDGSGSSIEGEAGKAEADAVKKEKEDNKDNTQVVDPDLSDVEGTEAANDKEYDENGDLIVPDYETGDIGMTRMQTGKKPDGYLRK